MPALFCSEMDMTKMQMIRVRMLGAGLGVLLLAGAASAQSFVRLATKSGEGTLSPSVSSFEIDSKDVGAFGTVTLQPLDSYTGVWEVQCAVDGETYDADSELLIKAKDSTSTPVTSVTNTVAVYDVLNAVGCKKIKVIVVSGFSATDTTMKWTASQVGGTSSGGGGGAGTSDTTETTQLAVLAAVDGIETLLGTANTSLAIIDNIVFGPGTAAAAQRVTFASDAPAVTVTDGAGALNVICDSGCAGSGTLGTQDTGLGTITNVTGGLQFGRASAAAPTSVSADDDAVLAWYLRNGAQATVITAAGALIGGDATNGLDVDVTRVSGTVTVSATNLDVQIGGSDSLTIGTFPDNEPFNVAQIGGVAFALITTQADDLALTQDAIPVSAINYCYDGTNLDLCRTATGGAGAIDSNTGRVTIAIDDDVSDAATLFEANLVAHDAADAGNPLKVGGRAVSFGATPTAVAAADRADFLTTRAGVPFVQPGHPNVLTVECQDEDGDGALTNSACLSVSAGTKIVLLGASIHCDASTTNPTNIAVGFGTSTLAARAHTGTAGYIFGFDGVPPGGGANKGYNGGIVAVGADDEDIRWTTEDPAGGACSLELSYYTIAG